MAHIRFIDSSFVEMLTVFSQELKKKGGGLILASIPVHVRNTPEVVALSQALWTFDSVQEALRAAHRPQENGTKESGETKPTLHWEIWGQVTVVYVNARALTDVHVGAFQEQLEGLVGQDGQLVLDLKPVKAIDQSGLDLLVAIADLCESRSGILAITSVQPELLKTLQVAQLDKRIKIYPAVAQAVESLGGIGGAYLSETMMEKFVDLAFLKEFHSQEK